MVHYPNLRYLVTHPIENPFTFDECELILRKYADAMSDQRFEITKSGTHPKCKCIALRMDGTVIPLAHAYAMFPLTYRENDCPACTLNTIKKYPMFMMYPEYHGDFMEGIENFNSQMNTLGILDNTIVAFYLFDDPGILYI